MGRRRDRILLLLLVAGFALASLALVILSPLALRPLVYLHGFHWQDLSNVGQTYGAVSALLAALALVGVALSVFLQVRETRNNRLEAGRTRHYELVRMALDDPLYFQAEAWLDVSTDMKRLLAYTNLRLQFWQMLWEFDELSELELRESLAPGIFATPVGRYYWEQFGRSRTEYNVGNRRQRGFNRILEEEYRKAVASGPQTSVSSGDADHLRPQRLRVDAVKVRVALAAAALVGAILDRVSLARGSTGHRGS